MRRRRLALAFLAAAVLFGTFPAGGRLASAVPRPAGETVAREIVIDTPALGAGALDNDRALPMAEYAGSTGEPVLRYTSPVIASGQLFDRVGARWTTATLEAGEEVYAEVRVSADGLTWSAWQPLPQAHDLEDDATMTFYAPPQTVPASRFAQYRMWLADGDPAVVRRVGLVVLDVTGLNQSPISRLADDVRAAFDAFARPHALAAPAGASRILTRADWGADESLMRWTPRSTKPHTKAILHHTVTGDGGSNVAAEIRSMYYFHAVTRGWGDIGYHYLIDKFGNIWTGRQGGDHVDGGHAFGWNFGSMGVAAIGTYTSTPPTAALQGGMANIIALKFKQYGIVPYGADPFVHQERRTDGSWTDVLTSPPNIIGHRDANYIVGGSGGQTACPGNTIADMIDGLRRLTQTAYDNGYTQLFRLDPTLPRATFPGATMTVPVTVANRGATAIPAGTIVSYQIITPSYAPVVPMGGRATITAPIAPNGTTTVQVPFTGPPQGSFIVRWDLHTGSAWWNNVYRTPVRDQWLSSRDWSADWRSNTVPAALTAGETRTVQATLVNDGGRVWNATGTNPVKIAYVWRSVATGNIFQGAQRATLPRDVHPGQSITVSIPVVAPVYPTSYVLRLDLVKENEFAFSDRGIAPSETTVGVRIDARARYEVGAVPALQSGQTVSVPVTITNTGSGTFPVTSAQPVTLGYHWVDAQGRFAVHGGPRTRLPVDLLAGQSVALQAQVTAPSSGGTFTLKFDLVQEGVSWFSTRGTPTGDRSVTVAGPVVRTYAAQYVPQVQALAATGAQTGVPITVTNASNFTWPAGGANPIRLSYHWWSLTTHRTVLWEGQRTVLPADLAPGQSVNLSALVRFPDTAGTYLLRWDMVEEGVAWFSGQGVATGDQFVRVEAPRPFTYGSSMLPNTPSSLAAGATAGIPVRVQNLGQTTWDAGVNLSYHWYDSAGRVVTWEGLRTSLDGTAPGAVTDVVAQVAAPASPGTYTLVWDIVREGHAWFSGQGVQMPRASVSVVTAAAAPTPPPSTTFGSYGASYAPQVQSVTAAPGATVTVPVMLMNGSSFTWQPGTINMSYHLDSQASGALVEWDGVRTALASPVAPNALVTVQVSLRAPATPGSYTVRLDLVHEGVTWFSGKGVTPGSLTLVVR